MTPDDFLKELSATADTDQGLAAVGSLAHMTGVFHAALLAEGIDEQTALILTCEMLRCMIGDHKAT